MTNVAWATANIFLSLVLGAITLVFVSLQFPGVFALVLDGANWVEGQLGNTGLETRYNNWVRFLIGDEQLTFMFFTVVARVILAFATLGVQTLMSRR